jgi:NADP-dependent aldehyde dehydrogenase
MQQTITGAQLIGFFESAASEDTFQSRNPDSGNTQAWTFHEASEQEIDRAMELAASAYTAYRDLPARQRALFLNTISEKLEAGREEIIQVYCLETGLPAGRAGGELGRTQGQLKAFADLLEEGSWQEARIETALPERTPIPRPDIRKCLIPLGPVVVFGASNFPLAFSTAGGDTASALAAGCPVVVKGHPLHPATGELVARSVIEAARELDLPEGTFSFLHGSSHDLGRRLVQHPQTAAVGFTGSRAGGLALARLSEQRERPIPVFAEMGSINPVVLLPSALELDAGWANAYAGSVTLGTGQFCTNPGLIIAVNGAPLDTFRTALARAISEIPTSCMLDTSIAQEYRRMRTLLLQQPGVTIEQPIVKPEAVNRVPPTVAGVSAADFLDNPVLQQEVFGPFTLVVACEDQIEMQQVIASLEGQLTGSVLGNASEFKNAAALIESLQDRVGRLLFNGVPTGVEVCPSMHHGGPFPATTDSRFTAVGTDAIKRWVRPVSFQNCPEFLLPECLKNSNPGSAWRLINGTYSTDSISL